MRAERRSKAVQFPWDCLGEAEGILIKNKKGKSYTKGKLATRFPFWRERGPPAFGWWWKVESSM